jgi:MoaA/NifB/PqqE/SkfB family radical SAM enzyme
LPVQVPLQDYTTGTFKRTGMLPDALNLIRTLTFSKLLNLLVVQLSFRLSDLLRKPIVWGKPWFVSIEPASVCNLNCPQCPAGQGEISRKKKFMDYGQYGKLLEELSSTTLMLSLYFQGEPLMHGEFERFVQLANERNVYTQTSTNGQLLTGEVCRGLVNAGLDRIIISLDGTNPESYRAYRRGGDFRKVEDGIRTLARMRREAGSRKPYIIVQFLVFRHNLDEIRDVKEMARELGADRVRVKTAQVEYPESADLWIPDDPEYSRYEMITPGEWKRKGKLRNRCRRLWQTTVITSDGLAVPCCFDKRATCSMGDTGEEGIARIWKNKSYQDFRKQVLASREKIAICTNCTEGFGRIFL